MKADLTLRKRGYYATSRAENAFSGVVSQSMTMDYVLICYKKLKEVTASYHSVNVWIEKGDGDVESFVAFVQLFSHKTATRLESTGLAAYPVLSIVLNVSARRTKWLIYNGNMLTGILPICCSDQQLEEERSKADENVCIRIYILDEGAVGEWSTRYCRLSGERMKDWNTSRSCESRSGTSAGT